ncbi:HAD-IA family hydrolase [Marivita hallyeonensis]|uniref:Phosphoglycolate phosphatase n=1 Tax=Marivita hallyeonensis TaxID=996342 RepID=A0A1M5N5A8_9RHOB|nr:HAD-IA family hydrolase [Marivita hallyeonensis]SHG84776.1 phosphoglycolate phosphatase [Marivita hallyeonensis]
MSGPLRLVVFDVDGTLVNSQSHILVSMRQTFDDLALPVPEDQAILQGIGLSLPELMARLVPDADANVHEALAIRYKELSYARHATVGRDAESPFYPGMRDVLEQLRKDDFTLLATATGKSRRGLNRMIAHHGLHGYFQSTQVADDHPSKPHPSMLLSALSETGVDAENAIMIGDTSFDMAMGKAAGMATIAVSWGYHPISHLAENAIVESAEDLMTALNLWMERLA